MLMPTWERMHLSGGWSPSFNGTCCCTFTAHRTVDAVERNQQGVAAGLHQPAAEFANRRIDQRATERTQPLQCTGNIEAYQAAVADHVGVHDSKQPTATGGLAGEVELAASLAHA